MSASAGDWGVKLAWTLGGLGAISWLPILSVIALVRGKTVPGLCGLAIFLVGCAYLWRFSPWKRPHVTMRKLYFGYLLILLLGLAAGFWQMISPEIPASGMLPTLLMILPLAIPLATLGDKTWNDWRPQP